MYRLLIERRGRRPQVFKLVRKTTTIGRGKDTDLLLPDISVSRHHAKIEQRGSDLFLVDLGSQNGTKINDKRIKDQKLKSGDSLQIGKFIMVFEQKAVRAIQADPNEKGISKYTLEEERTGFLKKVSAIDGDQAHSTTQLSADDLENVRMMMRMEENGKIALADQPQTSWLIGKAGLRFGGGGVPAAGMGLGGSAGVKWTGKCHVIEKLGGLFFTLTVNGKEVKGSCVLKPGDTIMVGKTAFSYLV